MRRECATSFHLIEIADSIRMHKRVAPDRFKWFAITFCAIGAILLVLLTSQAMLAKEWRPVSQSRQISASPREKQTTTKQNTFPDQTNRWNSRSKKQTGSSPSTRNRFDSKAKTQSQHRVESLKQVDWGRSRKSPDDSKAASTRTATPTRAKITNRESVYELENSPFSRMFNISKKHDNHGKEAPNKRFSRNENIINSSSQENQAFQRALPAAKTGFQSTEKQQFLRPRSRHQAPAAVQPRRSRPVEDPTVRTANWQKRTPPALTLQQKRAMEYRISQIEQLPNASPDNPQIQTQLPGQILENSASSRQDGPGSPSNENLNPFFGIQNKAKTNPATNQSRATPPLALPSRMKISVTEPELSGEIDVKRSGDKLNLRVSGVELSRVLAILAEQQGVNIISDESASSKVTVTLRDVTFEEAMDALLSVGGYTWTRQKNIILVTQLTTGSTVAASVQGREVLVIPLNYASAIDVDAVVQKLLSPVGKSFFSETNPENTRQTQEKIVVEDLPAYLKRIEEYIKQVDLPPRQVLIEAHVFSIDLNDNTRHGVNLEYLAEMAGSSVSLATTGFANPLASPSLLLNINGGELETLVEALKTTSDAKTLASPRVLALNGQQAKIQIGSQLGYFVTTTTETSTLQSVQFLDVGVVLTVTPYITDDNHIIMKIKPEVSNGRVSPDTGLPEENTTEVETSVMLADNHGMIIGGLIKETDTESTIKVPLVGDMWMVGRLFQKRTVERRREEIIIALIPRIVPYTADFDGKERSDYSRASTPLLQNNLKRVDRPWEVVLPDAERNPRRVKVRRLPKLLSSPFKPFPRPVEYFIPSKTEEKPWFRGRLE